MAADRVVVDATLADVWPTGLCSVLSPIPAVVSPSSGQRVPPLSVLEVVAGTHVGKQFPLAPGRILIGRHPACGIVLDAVSVSRHHAAIEIDERDVWIEDLGSRNGTLVDGRPILGRRPLAAGEQIQIGDQRLRMTSAGSSPKGRDAAALSHSIHDAHDSVIVSEVAMPGRPEDSGGDHSGMLRASLELDRAVGASVALDDVLPRMLDAMLRIFPQAERALLLLVDPTSGRLVLHASRFAATVPENTALVSRTLMDRVMRSRQAVLSADVAADSRFGVHDSAMACGIRSLMCVPFVRADGVVLGILQIDRSDAHAPFRRPDLDLLAGVAGQVTRAIEQAQAHEERVAQERLRCDLELARRVQQGLLPSQPPDIAGYELFDHYEPARQISGDFFTYIPLANQRVAVVLADVSGKGVSAALVMAALSADVRYCLASEADAGRAVARINESLCRSGWEDRFVTLLVAVLDPLAHRLTLVNAGHMPPLLRDEHGRVRPIGVEESGIPLGIEPDQCYTALDVEIGSGTTVVLYTDGISEAMDHAHRPYGVARLERMVAEAHGGAAGVGRHLLADVDRYTAGQVRSDDICVVCLSRAAAAAT